MWWMQSWVKGFTNLHWLAMWWMWLFFSAVQLFLVSIHVLSGIELIKYPIAPNSLADVSSSAFYSAEYCTMSYIVHQFWKHLQLEDKNMCSTTKYTLLHMQYMPSFGQLALFQFYKAQNCVNCHPNCILTIKIKFLCRISLSGMSVWKLKFKQDVAFSQEKCLNMIKLVAKGDGRKTTVSVFVALWK